MKRTRAQFIDDHACMKACLKLAIIYVGVVQNELRIYAKRVGHRTVNFNVGADLEHMQKLIAYHERMLQKARNGKQKSKSRKRTLRKRG